MYSDHSDPDYVAYLDREAWKAHVGLVVDSVVYDSAEDGRSKVPRMGLAVFDSFYARAAAMAMLRGELRYMVTFTAAQGFGLSYAENPQGFDRNMDGTKVRNERGRVQEGRWRRSYR